ncbi:MAG: hypothetical protein KZQ64_06175 [gamma proteobacterium symbiont of Bathyaustriella thionipta]|nr:hypothetical protein [gamma proteobacterium symbiont of Bathyaustriella thionipta]MCU7950343.1 hypothetical protein [gamma proteobacterium symbiont of Bathyaustriella thionipta]MCU7952964.1 hypothetical protein [gamma proteobacterium symbiont of Bathyaustriella thionipta]MCU7956873.1 hypothetical protein [gamma proteobacterium symbiont of Bathyaustriella thionipta]MCU7967226.1 hypothetical protein [gamma proteobacterium symbiont of Bathyaustriella thionipta]
MSNDIPPLVPASSPPLVREKRHYPGDQKNQKHNKKKSEYSATEEDQLPEETDDDLLHKPVNTDKNNVKVGHIDEYV